MHLLYGRIAPAVIVAGTIVASLACAEIVYRFVERPAIALGRRLASTSATMRQPA
jgi:peptidoglycan/LPS O-acetylase OafA/YrhL